MVWRSPRSIPRLSSLAVSLTRLQVQAQIAQGFFAQALARLRRQLPKANGQSVGRAPLRWASSATRTTPSGTSTSSMAPTPTELLSSDMTALKSCARKRRLRPQARNRAVVLQASRTSRPFITTQKGGYAYVRLYTPIFKTFPPSGPASSASFRRRCASMRSGGFVSQGAQSEWSRAAALSSPITMVCASPIRTPQTLASPPSPRSTRKRRAMYPAWGSKRSDFAYRARSPAGGFRFLQPPPRKATFQGVTAPGSQTQSQFAACQDPGASTRSRCWKKKPAPNILSLDLFPR